MKQILIGIILTIVGAGIAFAFGKPILDKAQASTEWPSVQGRIVESGVEVHRSRRSRAGRGFRRRRTSTTYRAHVVYDYSVDGEGYENDRLWYGTGSSSSTAKAMVAKYSVGKQVDVYYQPDNPNEAVLMPGTFFSSYTLFGVGLLMLVIGLGILAAPLLLVFVATATPPVTATNPGQRYADSPPDTSDEGVRLTPKRRGRPPQNQSDDDGFDI